MHNDGQNIVKHRRPVIYDGSIRGLPVKKEVQEKVNAEAKRRSVTVSQVMRDALNYYLNQP